MKSNKWIWPGITAQISILSILVYLLAMQIIFGTTALGPFDWAYLLLLAELVVFPEEIQKMVCRKTCKNRIETV